MKYLYALLISLLAITLNPMDAQAQINPAVEQLSALNRIDPMQNPQFDRGDKVMGRKITDGKNKVIGYVQDIIVNPNGTIALLKTEFDRLHLGDSVYLNYRNMRVRPVSNTYSLDMDAEELEAFFPQLMSNIETASGEDSDTYSLHDLMGVDLWTNDGRRIGKVDNVLFSSNGGIVAAVYAELSYGVRRGEKIAIPFRSVDFKDDKGRIIGTVDQQLADAMMDMVDKR